MFKNYITEVKRLMSKGFATSDEQASLLALYKDLDTDEQEVVEDKQEETAALPEEAPADDAPADADKADADDDDSDDAEAEKEEIEKGIKNLIAQAAENITSDVKSEVKTWLKEQKELSTKGAGAYEKDVKEQRVGMNSYIRNMFKALQGDQKAEFMLKEMSTDATGSPFAGFVVDSELAAEILHLTTEYGVASSEMNVVQLSKNSYKANNLATDVTVGWTDEGAAIDSTEAVLGQGELNLNKLTAISSFTAELLEDEEIDLVSFIASRVAEGFARSEDEAFFDGDGTAAFGGFTGLLQDTNTNLQTMATNTFADLDADDLIDMVDATPQGAHANAKFYMNRTIMSIVRKLKDTTGAYIYQAPSVSGPATVWGFPVVLVEAMPSISDDAAATAFVLFGDLRKTAIYGFKGGLRADRFNSGTIRNVADSSDINLITTDREAVRWVKRVGYLSIVPTATTRLETSA